MSLRRLVAAANDDADDADDEVFVRAPVVPVPVVRTPVVRVPVDERARVLAETGAERAVGTLIWPPSEEDVRVLAYLGDMLVAAVGGEVVSAFVVHVTPEAQAYAASPEGIAAEAARRAAADLAYRVSEAERDPEWCARPWAWASRRANREVLGPLLVGRILRHDLLEMTSHIVDNGWSFIFQNVGKNGERRYTLGGVRGSKDDATPSTRALVRTTEEQRTRWAGDVRRSNKKGEANVALVTGPATGVLVIDNDCNAPLRNAVVDRIRVEELGQTPYVRGRSQSPRNGCVYLLAPADYERMRKTEVKWEKDEGAGSCDAVEVQWKTCFTIHGTHHRTGEVYDMSGPLPGMDPGATPDLAPVVTAAQVERFLARCAAECPGTVLAAHRPSGGQGGAEHISESTVSTDGLYVPGLKRYRGAPGTVVRDLKVVRGARNHAYAMVCDVVSGNPAVSIDLLTHEEGSPEHDAAAARITAVVMQVLRRDLSTECKTTPESALLELPAQIGRAVELAKERILRGAPRPDLHVHQGVVVGPGLLTPERTAEVQRVDPDLDALVPGGRTRLPLAIVPGAGPEGRALLDADGRAEQSARVARQVEEPIQRWLDAVWDVRQRARHVGREELARLERAAQAVLLLLAPTGAGKTSTLMRLVAAQIARRGKVGPILFMAPSYGLLADVMDRVAGDAERAATEDAEREGRAMGLRVMTYEGKARLCSLEQGPILAAAGMSIRGACEGTVMRWDAAERKKVAVKVPCHLKTTCRAWTQVAEIASHDVVFLPTSYVSLPVPRELKAAVALVVDESVSDRFLRSDTLAVESLSLPRREPFVSKAQEAAGLTSDVLLQDRAAVAAVLADWARRNAGRADAEDVGAVLLDHPWERDTAPQDRTKVALARVESARRCMGKSLDTHHLVTPETTVAEARALADGPVATDGWAEWHLYDVSLDRMRALAHDRLHAALAEAGGVEPPRRLARGARDARLQVLSPPAADGGERKVRIRVSWRAKNSFGHLPTLLMDASADTKTITKLWHGREVEVAHAPVRHHLRVVALVDRSYSDSSMQPWRHDGERRRQRAAQLVTDVRAAVDAVSGLWGHSQVVVASTRSVETLLNTAWRPWANVSWLHYGACVGLDFAKAYPAAVVIGRQELPVPAVDARVGGLTYDDDEPEAPVDALGTGLDAENRELRIPDADRRVPMRSGHDLLVRVPTHAGDWAAAVQRQAREEQQLQALGRLRTAHRDGEAPVAVLLGSVIPEGVVVDVACGIEDVRVQHAQAVREAGVAGYGLDVVDARPHIMSRVDRVDPHSPMAPAWADMTERRLRGMVRYAYERADGMTRECDVPACEARDLAAVVERVRRYEEASYCRTEWDRDATVREVRRGAPLSDLAPRRPDRRMVDLLGTAADQEAAERHVAARLPDLPAVAVVDAEGKVVMSRSHHPVLVKPRVRAVLHALGTEPVAPTNRQPHLTASPEESQAAAEAVVAVPLPEWIDPDSLLVA